MYVNTGSKQWELHSIKDIVHYFHLLHYHLFLTHRHTQRHSGNVTSLESGISKVIIRNLNHFITCKVQTLIKVKCWLFSQSNSRGFVSKNVPRFILELILQIISVLVCTIGRCWAYQALHKQVLSITFVTYAPMICKPQNTLSWMHWLCDNQDWSQATHTYHSAD